MTDTERRYTEQEIRNGIDTGVCLNCHTSMDPPHHWVPRDGHGVRWARTCPECDGRYTYRMVESDEEMQYTECDFYTPANPTETIESGVCLECGEELDGTLDGTPVFDDNPARITPVCDKYHFSIDQFLANQSDGLEAWSVMFDVEPKLGDCDIFVDSTRIAFVRLFKFAPMARRKWRAVCHVHRSTMDEAVAELREAGVIERRPHEDDGRVSVYGIAHDVYPDGG